MREPDHRAYGDTGAGKQLRCPRHVVRLHAGGRDLVGRREPASRIQLRIRQGRVQQRMVYHLCYLGDAGKVWHGGGENNPWGFGAMGCNSLGGPRGACPAGGGRRARRQWRSNPQMPSNSKEPGAQPPAGASLSCFSRESHRRRKAAAQTPVQTRNTALWPREVTSEP
jgi:hypothetical protein